MPVDRFFHPRAGHSTKVASLTDFEFRIWWSYVMAADDFGVMRCSAVTIQAANDALSSQPKRRVELALQRLIDIGLVVAFEHQERRYVCQLDWQDFQKVKWPRESHEPVPTPEVLARCSEKTRGAFMKRLGKTSEELPENLEELPKDFSRARAREEANANGLRQEANGKRQTAAPADELGSSAERVLDAFRQHWKQAYGHESSCLINHLQQMQLDQQIAAHSEQKLIQALAAYFATDDEYVKRGKHPLPLFLRDPLKYLVKVVKAAERDYVAETQAQADAILENLRNEERMFGRAKS